MTTWLTIIGMALVTLLTRALPMLVLRHEVAPWLSRWLSFVPIAVFTALALPPLLIQRNLDGVQLVAGVPLLVGFVGALVAWRTRSTLLTVIVGMACYWLLRWLGIA